VAVSRGSISERRRTLTIAAKAASRISEAPSKSVQMLLLQKGTDQGGRADDIVSVHQSHNQI
jgi:hypothetical protein